MGILEIVFLTTVWYIFYFLFSNIILAIPNGRASIQFFNIAGVDILGTSIVTFIPSVFFQLWFWSIRTNVIQF